MKLATTLTAALLVLAGQATAAEPVYPFSGPRTLVSAKHLIPVLSSDDGYGEKYTFNADFGDQGSFYFSLTISNLGFGEHKMEAKGRLSVGDQKFSWKKEMDKGDWKHSKSDFSITAGPAHISGTPDKLLMKASKGNDAVELTFTPIARPWRPRGGQIHFGKDRKKSDFTVFPLMAVEGRYKMGGGDWQPLTGRGHGTRTWSDIAVYEQARWTMEFRGIQDDYTVYIRQLSTGADFERMTIPYLIVTKGDKLLIESFDFTFKPTAMYEDSKHANKYKVPESFQVLGTDAEEKNRQFRGSMTKKKLLKRKDMLEDMSAPVRAIAGRYSKPVEYDYETDFTVEVKVGDQVERIQGVGRYQMYHWNQ